MSRCGVAGSGSNGVLPRFCVKRCEAGLTVRATGGPQNRPFRPPEQQVPKACEPFSKGFRGVFGQE
jgi:hypothetical protein